MPSAMAGRKTGLSNHAQTPHACSMSLSLCNMISLCMVQVEQSQLVLFAHSVLSERIRMRSAPVFLSRDEEEIT